MDSNFWMPSESRHSVYASVFLSPCSDFDKRVNDNKTAAEDAMKKIPEINATIIMAAEKTRQAEGALGNAAADAAEAKNKAEEAENIANAVQKVRSTIGKYMQGAILLCVPNNVFIWATSIDGLTPLHLNV